VDGNTITGNAAAKAILGPLTMTPGEHTVNGRSPDGSTNVVATVKVGEGSSTDVVLHRQVDPSKPPVITTFPNDLNPVAAGSGRVVVAHTAAVGPADVRVAGKVLFANIASGEALTLTVPAGSYSVDIVPAATSGPTVLGPVDLPVAKQSLTRVFAIGVAATGSMDAVVQVLPLATRGTGTAPGSVNAGDGGQAVSLMAGTSVSDVLPTDPRALVVVGWMLALVGLLRWPARRRPAS